MKSLNTTCGFPMFHEPINRKLLKRWKREWKLSQFLKKPLNITLLSVWVSFGATALLFGSPLFS